MAAQPQLPYGSNRVAGQQQQQRAHTQGASTGAPLASYSGMLLSSSSTRSLTEGSSSSNVLLETDDVWENQRGNAMFGTPNYSAKGLLPTDRSQWSDAQGNFKLAKEKLQLPDPRQWEWVSDWMVDMHAGVDAEGWQYAFNFTSSSWSPECSRLDYVRRRRWKRLRRLRADLCPLVAEPNDVSTATAATTASTASHADQQKQQSQAAAGVEVSTSPQQLQQQQRGLSMASKWVDECPMLRIVRDIKLRSDLGRLDAVRKAVCAGAPCEGQSRAHLESAVDHVKERHLEQSVTRDVDDKGDTAEDLKSTQTSDHDVAREHAMLESLFGTRDPAQLKTKVLYQNPAASVLEMGTDTLLAPHSRSATCLCTLTLNRPRPLSCGYACSSFFRFLFLRADSQPLNGQTDAARPLPEHADRPAAPIRRAHLQLLQQQAPAHPGRHRLPAATATATSTVK